MEEANKKTQIRFLNRSDILLIITLLVAMLFFYLNLFKTFSFLDILIIAVFVVAFIFLFRIRNREGIDHNLKRVVIALLISSYLISSGVRFFCISNNIREFNGIFLGNDSVSAVDGKELGISFPESLQVKYYREGVPWLEQSAKLIAVIDQEQLSKVTGLFNEINQPVRSQVNSHFWYANYLFSRDRTVYTYSNYVQSAGAVSAKILVVPKKNNTAKLYIDIIYW